MSFNFWLHFNGFLCLSCSLFYYDMPWYCFCCNFIVWIYSSFLIYWLIFLSIVKNFNHDVVPYFYCLIFLLFFFCKSPKIQILNFFLKFAYIPSILFGVFYAFCSLWWNLEFYPGLFFNLLLFSVKSKIYRQLRSWFYLGSEIRRTFFNKDYSDERRGNQRF